jgi:hypothetical protein
MFLRSTRSTSFFPTCLVHHILSPPEKAQSLCLRTKAEIALLLRSMMSILMLKSLLCLILCRILWFKSRILLRWNILPHSLIHLVHSQAMLLPAHLSILQPLLCLVLCSRCILQPLLTLAPRLYPSRCLHLYRHNIRYTHSIMCQHDKPTTTNSLPWPSYS